MINFGRLGHILLVDSQASARESYRHFLTRAGFKVVCVATAAEALRFLEMGDRPSVIVTEHSLPGVSGGDLLRQVHARWRFVPVVVYEENLGGILRSQLTGVGAVAAFNKPVDMPKLVGFLRQLTGEEEGQGVG